MPVELSDTDVTDKNMPTLGHAMHCHAFDARACVRISSYANVVVYF